METLRIGRSSRWIALVALISGLTWLVAGSQGQDRPSQPRSDAKVKDLLRQTLQEKVDGQPAMVSLVEVHYPAGGSSQPHRHPGPIVGYVLEGAIEFQLDDGPVQTIRAGETFFEPARALHKVSRNASQTEPARFLAYMLAPQSEKELVLPVD